MAILVIDGQNCPRTKRFLSQIRGKTGQTKFNQEDPAGLTFKLISKVSNKPYSAVTKQSKRAAAAAAAILTQSNGVGIMGGNQQQQQQQQQQASSNRLARSCISTNLNSNERMVILTKKRKLEDDFLDLSPTMSMSNYHNGLLGNNSNTNNNNNSANSNVNTNNNNNNPNNNSNLGNNNNSNNNLDSMCNNNNNNSSGSMNFADRNYVNHFVSQLTGKVMLKLDQINLKINQISDRLYNLERKFESIEVTEIL
jgi:hypothetical protein